MIVVHDEQAQLAALRLARGSYQRQVLLGTRCVSGADMRGYAGYWRSRTALFARMTAAGIPWRIEREPKTHLQYLVLGNPPAYPEWCDLQRELAGDWHAILE